MVTGFAWLKSTYSDGIKKLTTNQRKENLFTTAMATAAMHML